VTLKSTKTTVNKREVTGSTSENVQFLAYMSSKSDAARVMNLLGRAGLDQAGTMMCGSLDEKHGNGIVAESSRDC
jgi:hypothetical protein